MDQAKAFRRLVDRARRKRSIGDVLRSLGVLADLLEEGGRVAPAKVHGHPGRPRKTVERDLVADLEVARGLLDHLHQAFNLGHV